MAQSKYTLHNQLTQMNTNLGSTYLDFIQSRRGKKNFKDVEKLFECADERMSRIHDIIWQISDNNVPVLITGEKSVGKNTVARAIHKASSKENEKAFVSVDCSEKQEISLDLELFGFCKNAFPGAVQDYVGKIEQASDGTLVLENITDMDMSTQGKLLKILQDKSFERSGNKTTIPLKARIIASSNKDMMQCVNQGKFRQDLYYRLYVLHFEIPPLRERVKDIDLLSKKYMKDYCLEFNKPEMHLNEDVMKRLKSHDWPGNIRELQDFIYKLSVSENQSNVDLSGSIFCEKNVAVSAFDWICSLPIGKTLRLIETHFILETIKHHHGNRTHAAKTLGISLRTLRNKINEFTAEGFDVMAPMSFSKEA